MDWDAMYKQCDAFNAKLPPGSRMCYAQPGFPDRQVRTTTEAMVGHESVVVWVSDGPPDCHLVGWKVSTETLREVERTEA